MSEGDFEFFITKEDMEKLKQAFKPVLFEEYLKFQVDSTGVTISTLDNGVTSWVKIFFTQEVTQEGVFHLERSRVNKLADACTEGVSFEVKDFNLNAHIGSTVLHMTLPLCEINTNLGYESTSGETLSSARLKDLTSRCRASGVTNSLPLYTMTLGEDWTYGVTQSITRVAGGFENLSINLPPSFMHYLSNICTTGEDIKFTLDEYSGVLVVESGGIFHKVSVQERGIEGVGGLFSSKPDFSASFEVGEALEKLFVLSVPLTGIDNPIFKFKGSGDPLRLEMSVEDIGNRVSHSILDVSSPEGDLSETSLSVSSYTKALKTLQGDSITMYTISSAVVVSDGVQTTALIKFL